MPLLVSNNNPGQASRIVRPGLVRPASSSVTPVDPLTVPGVLRVMYYNSPYPQKSAVASGDPASNGDAVVEVSDQYQPGGSQYDRVFNSVAQPHPLMQSDGLQFGTNSSIYYLNAYNNAIQAGIGSFTAYLGGTWADGSTWVTYGDNSTSSVIYIDNGGQLQVVDDSFVNIITGNPIPAGKFLLRIAYDSDTGAFYVRATGATLASGVTNTDAVLTLGSIGTAPISGVNNDSLDNRYLFSVFYDHVIPFGDATDLGIQQFLKNTFGTQYAL